MPESTTGTSKTAAALLELPPPALADTTLLLLPPALGPSMLSPLKSRTTNTWPPELVVQDNRAVGKGQQAAARARRRRRGAAAVAAAAEASEGQAAAAGADATAATADPTRGAAQAEPAGWLRRPGPPLSHPTG